MDVGSGYNSDCQSEHPGVQIQITQILTAYVANLLQSTTAQQNQWILASCFLTSLEYADIIDHSSYEQTASNQSLDTRYLPKKEKLHLYTHTHTFGKQEKTQHCINYIIPNS